MTTSPTHPTPIPLPQGHRLVRLDEAAGMLGLSMQMMRRHIREGRIPVVVIGPQQRRVLIDETPRPDLVVSPDRHPLPTR